MAGSGRQAVLALLGLSACDLPARLTQRFSDAPAEAVSAPADTDPPAPADTDVPRHHDLVISVEYGVPETMDLFDDAEPAPDGGGRSPPGSP